MSFRTVVRGAESRAEHGGPEPSHRILVVATDEDRATVLREMFESHGLGHVDAVADPRMALPAFRNARPDAVVVDPHLEHMDVGSVILQLHSRSSEDEFLPFLILDGNGGPHLELSTLESSIPTFFCELTNGAAIAAEVRRLLAIREKWFHVSLLADHAMARARRIEEETVARLAEVAQLKDHDGQDHVHTVGRLSSLIAAELGLLPDDCALIRAAAPLHDIGMIGIPDAIRLKDGPLSLDELDVIKTHTTLGAQILSNGSSRMFHMAEEVALYHHENWDGTGYTPGLEGESIPLAARIVRVADLFDAVTRQRAFDSPWTRDEAVEFIRGRSGHFFDPAVVAAFLEICDRGEDTAPGEAIDPEAGTAAALP